MGKRKGLRGRLETQGLVFCMANTIGENVFGSVGVFTGFVMGGSMAKDGSAKRRFSGSGRKEGVQTREGEKDEIVRVDLS